MAFALEPEGTVEEASRPVVIELGQGHARGMSVVDWQRQTGRPDHVRIMLRYDQARFEGLVKAALAAV